MAGYLRDLASQPFGPYLDYKFLTDACKSVPSKVLGLRDVMLECGGKPIGLTQCEIDQPEYDRERINAHGCVRFRGVLDLKHLSWLTPAAQKRVEKDIRKRDVALAIKDGRRITATSPSLRRLFEARGIVIKIMIQGVKHMSVGFLTTKAVPDGLRLQSKDRDRYYDVLSMDIATYAPSRKYLSRYRTLRLLQDLLKLHGQTISATGESNIPLVERTPQWFADAYRVHMARSPSARTRRLVYASSDSDIEPRTGGRLKARRERTLRHVSRSEVLSLLAVHAKWILQDQQQRQKKFLDVEVWEKWVRDSRRARRDAHRSGIVWGRDPVNPSSEGSSNDDNDELHRRVQSRKKSKPKSKTSKRQPQNHASGSRTTTSALATPSDDEHMITEQIARGTLRSYDPDFSPPSTPPASPTSSEASFPSRSNTPPNPEITALIPPEFGRRPTLPSANFIWVCPVANCRYQIDLLNLTEEQWGQLHEEDVRRLRAGGWKLRDDWVQYCFSWLVSVHYEQHVDKDGIVLRREGNMVRFEWKNPEHHKPWLPRRNNLVDTDPTTLIKEEHN